MQTNFWMSLSARVRQLYDTRSYADVVRGATSEPLNAALMWRSMLDVSEFYERNYLHCPRLANFFKVYILIRFARLHNGSRFHATLEWRKLFYTCRERMIFFYKNRAKIHTSPCHCSVVMKIPCGMSMMVKCRERKNEADQLDELGKELKKMRGPHVLDLLLFMHLSLRAKLGNDLALLIFDFVDK